MRVPEMKAREDFEGHLHATLAQGWSRELGQPVSVSPTPVSGSVPFLTHRLLGGFFTKNLCPRGGQFLRDAMRFTPRRHRLLAQWAATELTGRGPGMTLLSQPAFWVRGPVPTPENLLIVAGNQRLRLFDFHRMRARVWLKDGFSPRTMVREISLRSGPTPGPFRPLLAWDDGGSFFEEDLLDGWDLNRIPPWLPRKRLQTQARKTLLRWLERTQEAVDTDAYLDELKPRFHQSLQTLRQRFGPVFQPAEDWCNALANCTQRLKCPVLLAQTHGDFQWGNVFYERSTGEVVLIDWEHNGRRSFHFDFFTEALDARSSRRLAQRVRDFLGGDLFAGPLAQIAPPHRQPLLALFLLETLIFFMEESLTGPTRAPSAGLLAFIDACAAFGPGLHLALGETS